MLLNYDLPRVEAQAVGEEIPCPPNLKASYIDPGLGTGFIGVASLTMKNPDGGFAYQFNGISADGEWRLTGIAHIGLSDCITAYYAWLRGLTVPIALLHNVRLYHRGEFACQGGGGTQPGDQVMSEYAGTISPAPVSLGGGTGSTGCGSGGSSSTADEFYEMLINGVLYTCYSYTDENSTRVTRCDAN